MFSDRAKAAGVLDEPSRSFVRLRHSSGSRRRSSRRVFQHPRWANDSNGVSIRIGGAVDRSCFKSEQIADSFVTQRNEPSIHRGKLALLGHHHPSRFLLQIEYWAFST
jgi:hypothetical protein